APYRILHLAGHGAFEYPMIVDQVNSGASTETATPTITGMVLGNGIFITPGEVEKMRFVPELVFINCCHLGQMAGESKPGNTPFHRLAANLAAQFIRMGVRAVVAAGWAVDDTAASTFARTFYDHVLSG